MLSNRRRLQSFPNGNAFSTLANILFVARLALLAFAERALMLESPAVRELMLRVSNMPMRQRAAETVEMIFQLLSLFKWIFNDVDQNIILFKQETPLHHPSGRSQRCKYVSHFRHDT